MMRGILVAAALLLVGCATHKPPVSAAPSLSQAKHSVSDTGKNVVGARGHISHAQQLAEEADAKLMKVQGLNHR
jgi:uncharacterized lipoprotein YmbA